MSKKIVLVHGSYFANNFGDTLLIKLLCDDIVQMSDFDVRLAAYGHPEEQKSTGYKVIESNELHRVVKVVNSGGGYFGEPNVNILNRYKWSIRNYNRHLKWRSVYKNVPTAYIGIGVGPISMLPFRYLVSKELKRSDLVIVRDEESYDYCKAIGVLNAEVGIDYAFTLYDDMPPTKKKIVLIHAVDELNGIEREAIIELRKAYTDHKFLLIFDIEKSQNTKNRIYNSYHNFVDGFKDYKELNELLSIIKNSEIILTPKLHVGIIGIVFNCKIISIPYHQKTIRLYNQLGVNEYCIPQYSYSRDKLMYAINKIEEFEPDYLKVKKEAHKIRGKLKNFIFK